MSQDDKLLTLPSSLLQSRWMGWRLRLVVSTVMLCALGIFMGSRWLSQQAHASWDMAATPTGRITLTSADTPTLTPYIGWEVKGIQQANGLTAPLDAVALETSLRWVVANQDVERFTQQRQALSVWLEQWQLSQLPLDLVLSSPQHTTTVVPVHLGPKGWAHLGWRYWLLSVLALAVASVGLIVMVAGPQWRNAAFLVLTLGQGIHIYLMALDGALGALSPWAFVSAESMLRVCLDMATGAALIQVAAWHPKRMPGAHWVTAAGWLLAVGLGGLGLAMSSSLGWWMTQASCLLTGGLAVWLMGYNLKRAPHPITLLLRRLTMVTLLTWAALSVSIGLAQTHINIRLGVTQYGILVWHLFFATQLVLTPYLSRARPILQEFSLLAASSTVAAAFDLLFVAVFALGPFASMALSLFLALGSYVLVRRLVVTHVFNRDPITTERLFERLYRMARELERRPDRLEDVMQGLMRELFDPLETEWLQSDVQHSEVKAHGGMLLVPLPHLTTPHEHKAFLLKHADKGRRLFTDEDARLSDRIVDQIDRALRYDRAVEQGRSEERMRLAQDLHDDIGARLLTLMYQAPNPSIEEYIRHTLQDLKTLTRGLAVQSHTLADAASEWKRDVSHRLQVAHCELDWHFASDQNPELSVVQWSALTRILRELVNNTISHARATQVQVNLTMVSDCVQLVVTDNGIGREPGNWTHGLGLGGVRKRVKQLGGQVTWHEVASGGISCDVLVPQFSGLPPS
jgi:signal transduction histidine kinase